MNQPPVLEIVVGADVSCRRCGYNLRGLTQHALRPECGISAESSTKAWVATTRRRSRRHQAEFWREVKRRAEWFRYRRSFVLVNAFLVAFGAFVFFLILSGPPQGGTFTTIVSLVLAIAAVVLRRPFLRCLECLRRFEAAYRETKAMMIRTGSISQEGDLTETR